MTDLPPKFNPQIHVVVSISGYRLQADGWVKEKGVYKKDGMELIYEGDGWVLNGSREKIQFMEEIKPKD